MVARPLHEADAAVAKIQQMVGDHPRGAFVVDLDAGAARMRGGRGDPDIGDGRRVQGVQHHRIVADRRQQDHAVHRQAVGERLDVRRQIGRGQVDGLHHQVEAAGATGPQRAQLRVHGVGADLVQHESDLVRARAGQAAGRGLGPVMQLARRAQDLRAHRLTHVRLGVQHP